MWEASSRSFNDSWQRLRTSHTLLAGSALAALIGLALYGIVHDRTAALESQQQNALRLADSMQAHVSALIDQSMASLRGVEAELLDHEDRQPERQRLALRLAMRFDPITAYIAVVSGPHMLMVNDRGDEVVDRLLERQVQRASDEAFQLLPILRSPSCPDWCLPVVMRGYGERRLVAFLPVRRLLGMQDALRMLPGAYVGFATSEGRRLFHYHAGSDEIRSDPRPLNERFLAAPRGSFEAVGRVSGEPSLFGHARSARYPFIAAVGVPKRMVEQAWLQRAAVPLALLLLATLTIVAMGARLVRARRAERRHLRQLEHQAAHDGTTGLLKHASFERLLQRRMDGQEPLALLLLGLNHLTEITETLGHQAGDTVLREFSQRLKLRFDPQRCGLARVGGSEIALAVPLDEEGSVDEAGRRAREALSAVIVVDGVPLQMSASTGLALFPEDGGDPKELLRRADIAMHAARNARRHQLRYTATLERFSTRLLALKADLSRALSGGAELGLVYQPKVELASGRLCGVEALSRWQHPRRGPVPPSEFVPLAESCELIHPFTERVLDLALAQCAQWHAAGHALPVAVNISVNNLMSADFVATTQALLERHGVPAELLEMEVTESALMRNPETALACLQELRALGVGLAIDDFGSGYASLAYLKKLPVGVLKIDKSFTSGLAGDAANRLIVRWTIGLAQGLGLKVVAEGVETAEEAELLRLKNCDMGQGYHFARPLPAAEFAAAWLRDRRSAAEASD